MKRRLKKAALISVCLLLLFALCMEYVHYGNPFLRIRMAAYSMLWPEQVEASKAELKARTNFLTFSRIDKAQSCSLGEGTRVAICDWLFDLRGEAATNYVSPVSMVPGEPVGGPEPGHGEWMAELVHQTAPACKIIPIQARTEANDYQQYLIKGIRYAADNGAVAVTSSLGPLTYSEELRQAIEYAEAKGTLFINVHPVRRSPRKPGGLNEKLICTGLISVPWHPAWREAGRDIHVWPYALTPTWGDGWGYSDGPPIVAGVVALMKSANPALTPRQVKELIVRTAFEYDGFRVLDAQAAVQAAIERKKQG